MDENRAHRDLVARDTLNYWRKAPPPLWKSALIRDSSRVPDGSSHEPIWTRQEAPEVKGVQDCASHATPSFTVPFWQSKPTTLIKILMGVFLPS
jgi:hypothetical protein